MERGLDRRVLFTGYRDADLPAVLQALDVFVLMGAGSDESCRAALEAMAAGRPVVARRVGALPDAVLHGTTGLLLDDDRPESVEPALRELLADPERARAIGEAARRHARDTFSPERHAADVEAVYRTVLERRRRAPDGRRLIRQLMSCRGWSSDAYWAARITTELERRRTRGDARVPRGTDARVIARAREAGAGRIETLRFGSGMAPASDARRSPPAPRAGCPAPSVIVHVHRGKEHWLAAMANRLSRRPARSSAPATSSSPSAPTRSTAGSTATPPPWSSR